MEQYAKKPIEIALIAVNDRNARLCSDELTVVVWNLYEKFKTYLTPLLRNNVKIEEKNLKILQNVDQLKKVIISTDVNIILILGPESIKSDIGEQFDEVEVEDADNIGLMFARIPIFLYRSPLICSCSSQNKKLLIFSTIDDTKEIPYTVKKSARAMVLGAYILQRVTEIWNQEEEANERIYNRLRVVDENASDKTYQETCQSNISVENALLLIKLTVTENHKIPLRSEFVEIEDAFSRISSEAAASCSDVPSFPVAARKGYAIRVEKEEYEIEVEEDESREIDPILLDSDMGVLVEKEKPLDNATTVIPEENVTVFKDDAEILIHSCKIKYGQNVVFSGGDIKKGDLIVDEFTHIFSREIMLLTACGNKNVKVFKKLSLGVITIENLLEIEELFEKPEYPYDCNELLLTSLLIENHFELDFNFRNIVEDPMIIQEAITEVLKTVDLLVTTSNKDYLKDILKNKFNATFLFENVDMKPGKSTAFAKCYFEGKPKIILCLPKNPASVFVTAHVFLLPLVKWIHSMKEDWPIINVEVDKKLLLHHRPRYVWATVSWELYPKVTCKEEHSINNDLSDNDGNVILILPRKTLKKSTLEVSSCVPAMIVKFPLYNIPI